MTSIEPAVHYIHSEFVGLVEPLHEAFAGSAELIDNYLPANLRTHEHGWLRSANMRAAVRDALDASDLGDWDVRGNLALNGQLMLVNGAGDIIVRMLKDGKPPVRSVPGAGHNRARRMYWSNSLIEDVGDDALFGKRAHQMLGLWHENGDGTFEIRAVRPVGAVKYGSKTPIDLCLELAPAQSTFESLAFDVEDDDNEDLLNIHIANEENDNDASGHAG
ncbi:hypothetical protein [Arthrobacter sp. UYCu712]|uniref:hypothetical protein n=1 Tax=Arthrobacter sp. UYCu712 TaxID=3156340 RepID=UPI00339B2CD9